MHVNDVLLKRGVLLFQRGKLPQAEWTAFATSIGHAKQRIMRPPTNKLGQTCWDMHSPSQTSVVMRWIYGGGNIGVLAEGLLGVPAKKPWWNLDWSLEDLLQAAGLKTVACGDYFTAIRNDYDRAGKVLGPYDEEAQELADAAVISTQHHVAPDKAMLDPDTTISIGPWVLAAIGVVIAVKVVPKFIPQRVVMAPARAQ